MLEGMFLRLKQVFEPRLGNWLRGSLRAWAENLALAIGYLIISGTIVAKQQKRVDLALASDFPLLDADSHFLATKREIANKA